MTRKTQSDQRKQDQSHCLKYWINGYRRYYTTESEKHVKFKENRLGYQYSCDLHTALLSEHLHKNMDKYNLLAFTDISKAFDSVPLQELEYAILIKEIPNSCKQLLIDFARNRKFRVIMNEKV